MGRKRSFDELNEIDARRIAAEIDAAAAAADAKLANLLANSPTGGGDQEGYEMACDRELAELEMRYGVYDRGAPHDECYDDCLEEWRWDEGDFDHFEPSYEEEYAELRGLEDVAYDDLMEEYGDELVGLDAYEAACADQIEDMVESYRVWWEENELLRIERADEDSAVW